MTSHTVTLVKTASFKVWCVFTTVIVAFLFTHSVEIASAIGIVDFILDFIGMYLIERLWIRFGKAATRNREETGGSRLQNRSQK